MKFGFCRSLTAFGAYFQPIFLFMMRLIWGSILFEVGLIKVLDISSVVVFFSKLGLPYPFFTAYLVGGFEMICGLLLLLGLAARLASIPTIIIMIVALCTAHAEALKQFYQNPMVLSEQAPFPFLLLGLIILAFGPGKYSLDYLLTKKHCSKPCNNNSSGIHHD